MTWRLAGLSLTTIARIPLKHETSVAAHPWTNNLRSLLEPRREMKVRSFSGLTFKSDFAAHLFGQFGRDHEAEPGAAEAPAGRSFRLHKRLKQAPLRLDWNSNPGVDDLEPHQHVVGRVLRSGGPDGHLAALGELDRIRHQVVENLAQPALIAAQTGRHIYVHIQRKLDPFGASGRGKGIDQSFRQFDEVEVELLQHNPAGREFREVEYVVDDRQQQLAAGSNDLSQAALLGSQIGTRQQLAGADDSGQRSPNLVAHAGQEIRSQTGRFEGKVAHPIARAIGLFLGALAAGDIDQHPFVVSDLACRVVNGARTLLAPDDAAVAPAHLHLEVLARLPLFR